MTQAHRLDRASFLAAVAVLGLVLTPLLHAEQHSRDEHEDAEVAEAWRAGSSDPLEKLAYALGRAHRPESPKRDRHDGHSHGPASGSPHGAGALAHLGLALHAAPQLPRLVAVAPDHVAPAAIVAQLRGTLRYLVPEWSQGPPIGC